MRTWCSLHCYLTITFFVMGTQNQCLNSTISNFYSQHRMLWKVKEIVCRVNSDRYDQRYNYGHMNYNRCTCMSQYSISKPYPFQSMCKVSTCMTSESKRWCYTPSDVVLYTSSSNTSYLLSRPRFDLKTRVGHKVQRRFYISFLKFYKHWKH